MLSDEDFAVRVIERHMESSKVNIKNAGIIVAGGYGVGSRENFQLLYDLAGVLGRRSRRLQEQRWTVVSWSMNARSGKQV
jgi:electron transfer flavoprotein alpha subunit